LLAEIAALERQIEEHRRRLKSEQQIIDEVLCREFGYPLAEHLSRQRERFFTKPLVAMAAGSTLRNSSRFHHPAFEFVTSFFAKVPHEPVRRFLSVPIRLGATATKDDFVEEGDAFYVHPGATKTQGVIQSEDCYEVVSSFFDEHKRRVGLQPGDVIINRSGEALGKVALFDGEFPAVASDFTMRVRFNLDANPRFMWYFFRSVMFQAQIARELRGASMPNVFPGQIGRMLVATRSRSAQDALARTISDELESLRAWQARIAAAQRRIHELIDAAVESGAALSP
jgi:type I restriction enzyme S subunit